MNRSELKRKTKLQSRTGLKRGMPLKQVSKRQGRKNRVLAPVLKALHGTPCVIRWDDACTGMAEQGDHILSRARGGTNAPENLRGGCVSCHRKLTDNPAEAERRGLTLHAWERWPRCAACDTPHDPTGACMPGMAG